MKLQHAQLDIFLHLQPWTAGLRDGADGGTLARWNYVVKRQEDVVATGHASTYMDAVKAAEEAAVRHAEPGGAPSEGAAEATEGPTEGNLATT